MYAHAVKWCLAMPAFDAALMAGTPAGFVAQNMEKQAVKAEAEVAELRQTRVPEGNVADDASRAEAAVAGRREARADLYRAKEIAGTLMKEGATMEQQMAAHEAAMNEAKKAVRLRLTRSPGPSIARQCAELVYPRAACACLGAGPQPGNS